MNELSLTMKVSIVKMLWTVVFLNNSSNSIGLECLEYES